ncbi:MAG: hypothetical protein KDA21_14615 [Phycisphaerales bacterium]|nr:hypothetical protein [Phycisphaerales bacterium]
MPGGDRWIGDYRSMGLVEWPAGLREAMRARARRATGRFMGWTWLAVAAFVFSVAMAAVASGPSGRLWKPEFVFAGMGVLVFLVAVLRGNDWQKERIKARKALRSERLERFELGRHVEEEVAANRALGMEIGLGMPRVLLVAPSSALLLQVDGEAAVAVEEVVVHETGARAPSLPESGEGSSSAPLSPEEREELGRLIRVCRRPWKWIYLFYVWVSVGVSALAYRLAIGGGVDAEDWVLSGAVVILWPLMTHSIFFGGHRRRRRLVAALRRDLRNGRAEVVEGYVAAREARESQDGVGHPPVVTPEEVRRLCESGLWWEVDGVPAAWRRA